ncbi:MAG: MFS transporter [Bacteroidetes bacterium]|nr:MFS transporter [Bacteroidota bacterium]MDA1119806.1 MFS transporter [Bacteroidota bacterium]
MKSNQKFWWIVVLLLVATSLSFLDRQVLSVTIIKIKDDLIITDVDYGFINAGFLVSYAIMFTVGGILIDKYGSRMGLAFSVGFWSLATVLHSFAGNVFQFTAFRFLLGLGEGGCFPGAVRAVIEWVPTEKRALANGIAIGGAAFGAVLAPPLCAYFLGFVGWRWVFVITGAIGFLWLAIWLYSTGKIQRVNTSEIIEKQSIKSIISRKDTIIFMMMRFFLDPILYFYMFWIPKYLNETHDMSIDTIGQVLWIPFLALGVANIIGGWFSDLLYQKFKMLNQSRMIVMGLAALLTLPVALIGIFDSYTIILSAMTLAFFAHGLWITNYITSISDVFGRNSVSTVVGLSGSAGALSSVVLNPIIGYIISIYSYDSLWLYCGLMYPVVFIGYWIYQSNKKLSLSATV